MFERILVPLDGSETAEAVLPHVRRILQRHSAEFVILRVAYDLSAKFHISTPSLTDEAQRYVRRIAFTFTNQGVPAKEAVRVGDAAEEILAAAAASGATMIAMSTHGRSGLDRFVFGSVAEKVLRASSVPVMMIRSFPRKPEEGPSRGKVERSPFRNILIPLDGSDLARSVIPAVKEFAKSVDAHAILVNVVEDNPYGPRWTDAAKPLEEAEKELVAACIPVATDHRKGDAAGEILKAADEHEADLIAMATHGRSGPSRWVFGSVTEKVLRAAHTPLVVVPRGAGKKAAPAGSRQGSHA